MIFFFSLLCFYDFLNFLYWDGLIESIKILFKKDQDESFQTLFKKSGNVNLNINLRIIRYKHNEKSDNDKGM